MGGGGRGDWGWGCVNRRHLPLPSLSCRSLYGPCLGSASVNHVDHPRADRSLFPPSARSLQPACRAFRIGYVWYLLLARSRPGSPLEPVSSYVSTAPPSTLFRRPPSRSGHAASTAAKGPLASLVGAVALMDACKFAYWVLRLPRYQKPESPTYLLGLSITLQYYRYYSITGITIKRRCRRSGRPASALAKHDRALRHADVLT